MYCAPCSRLPICRSSIAEGCSHDQIVSDDGNHDKDEINGVLEEVVDGESTASLLNVTAAWERTYTIAKHML